MKRSIITIIILCMYKFSFAQTKTIVGAWYWKDSTTAISIFIEKDSSFSVHKGLKGETILAKNLLNGVCFTNKKIIKIRCLNSQFDSGIMKLLDDNSLEVRILPNKENKGKTKHTYVFSRIVDEATFDK